MVALIMETNQPAKRSIENISGCWAMSKPLSKEVDTMFKMQKVNWLVRKALKSATIYLNFVQHNTIDPDTHKPIVHLDITQTTSVGVAPIKNKRILNGAPLKHKDHVFGTLITESAQVRGRRDPDGAIRPDIVPGLNVGTADDNDTMGRFLRGEINVDGSESAGFLVENPESEEYGEGEGLWTHTLEREENLAWAAETVWGFEIVKGERCLTSRVVVVDDHGRYQFVHCVFQLQGSGK